MSNPKQTLDAIHRELTQSPEWEAETCDAIRDLLIDAGYQFAEPEEPTPPAAYGMLYPDTEERVAANVEGRVAQFMRAVAAADDQTARAELRALLRFFPPASKADPQPRDLARAGALLDVEFYIEFAEKHGEDYPDHECGDLQDFLREMWGLLTPKQRMHFAKLPNVLEKIEALGDQERDEE